MKDFLNQLLTGATYRVDLTTGNTTMALWTELY